jgi:HAE1 family hydrophobic/amphiphilic exporter-1
VTRFFVRHPVTTWMLFTAFVAMAIYAWPRLRLEAIPEVNLPSLTIQTLWNGASPQAIQRSITLPVEAAARRVHGVEEIISTSRAGRSTVEVRFRRDANLEFARLDLNEELGAVRRDLPLNAGQPEILPFVPEEFQTDEFFTVSLESSLDPNTLRERTETSVVPRILSVEGVADARVMGGADPLVKIVLDRRKLRLHDIDADAVVIALRSVDILEGAGLVHEDGEDKLLAFRSRVDLERIASTIVARRGDRAYTVAMLGEVRPDFEDPTHFVRNNGRNVVQVAVEKRSGANAVSVSRALREALPVIADQVPFDVTFSIDEDEGHDLDEKLTELVFRCSVILVFLLLLLVVSLREVRLTAIVTGSILFAVVISLSLFYFFGISVNFITISGLTVCFGLILDNSILVLDSIHRRLHTLERATELGLSRRAKLRVATRTIVNGASEVTFPILATSLTTIVAFGSFIFLSGRLAVYYVPLATSVATAMLASIFVAFAWIPVVLDQGWARWLVRRSPDGPNDADEAMIDDVVADHPDLDAPPRGLGRLFGIVPRLWWITIPATVVLLWWSHGIYQEKVFKGGFFRMPDQQEIFVYLELPAGTDVRMTSETIARFEESLYPVHDGATMRSTTFDNQAFIRVEFEPELLRTEVPILYRELLVEVANQTAGATVFIRGFADQPYIKGNFGGSAMNSIVEISGYNSKRLQEIAETALVQVKRQRRARNARITTGGRFERSRLEETVITLDRVRLAQHDLTVVEAAAEIRRLLGVDTPWTMTIEGEPERVQLGFADADHIEYGDVANASIRTRAGDLVKVADLVDLETRELSGPITRENQRYTVRLNWEYVGTDQMRRRYLQTVLASLDLPYGYEAREGEQTFFTQEEEEELTLALVVAVGFIFMILAFLFESLSLPLLVLFSLPLALVGVVLLFWIGQTTDIPGLKTVGPFDSSARIGLILLFGIVVNNAILLVSRFREEARLILEARRGKTVADRASYPELFGTGRRPGGSDLAALAPRERASLLRRAIGRGTAVRLRSVLLTSGTTVVGLLPLIIDFPGVVRGLFGDRGYTLIERFVPIAESDGQEIWENLAVASIGGLIASTVLLLIVVPAVYYLTIRVSWWAGAAIRTTLRWMVAAWLAASLVLTVVIPHLPALAGPAASLLDALPGWVGASVVEIAGLPLVAASPAVGMVAAVGAGVIALLLLLPWPSRAAAAALALILLTDAVAAVGRLAAPEPVALVGVVAAGALAYAPLRFRRRMMGVKDGPVRDDP